MTVSAITASLALGYAVGRARPWLQLADWVEQQARLHPARSVRSRWREAALFAALVATQPGAAFGALRRARRTRRGRTS